MSFEYIVEKDQKTVKLSDEEAGTLAGKISADFKTYNDGRKENIIKAEKLINEIFFRNNLQEEKDPKKKWKAKVKMCKTFMFYQTLKAFIWKNVYSNVNSMFDVSGENQDADTASNKQKAMLVDIFEKMEYPKTADTIIDNSLFYGELISFCAWKTKKEEYRRPINFFESLFKTDIKKLPLILKAKAQGKSYYVDEREVYNNPYVYAVNPADLAFDVTQADDWDSCPKIYKSWKTPDDIINNKFYTVSSEDAERIRALIKDPDSKVQANQSDRKLLDDKVNGNTVEVLEHWGTLKLADGTLLRNWHAVSVAGQFLVRFSKNETIINPFTYGSLITDPKTKRGLSPLICVLDLALLQEDLMNRTYNMQALNENPPLYAPEGFFTEEEIELYPGRIITFGDGLDSAKITPMTFNATVFLNDVSFISDLMSEVSGIFPNMAGSAEDKSKTATEISVKTQGQMTRLAMILDTINQYLVVPDVKNVAKLCANFKSGIEQIFINKDNKKEVIQIDDSIRQADYKYTYSDRTATADRFNKADMIIQAIQQFAKFIPLNVKELFTWYFEQKGVENPERFLQDQPTTQENPLIQQIKQLMVQDPERAKQILAQHPELAQMLQQSAGQPQGQGIATDEGVPQAVNENGEIPQTPIAG